MLKAVVDSWTMFPVSQLVSVVRYASGRLGIDRDHLKFVRRRCGHCKSETHNTTAIYVEDSPTIQRLMTASRALGLGSHSSVKSTFIPTSKSRSELTDLDSNVIAFGLAFRYSSVFWIGCGGDSARPIPTQMLQHRLTSGANSAFVPSCFFA